MGLGDLLFKGDHKIFFQRHKAADKKAELSWRELCLSVLKHSLSVLVSSASAKAASAALL